MCSINGSIRNLDKKKGLGINQVPFSITVEWNYSTSTSAETTSTVSYSSTVSG